MKRRYPTSSTSTNARDQLDNDFEQPRGAVEANIDQSSLRNFGRVVHEDELEERLQDTTIQLSRDSANSATVSPKNFRTEKGGIGMNYEHDQLLDATKKQLNFEEGLTPHPYKTEPWIISGRKHKVGDDEVHVMESGKTSTSCATWNWINCCFYLLAPLFIFFVIVTVVITLALLA
ncbi:unnamed protein product [Litomosoides sigmodontis]|uniref:Uncharacterized protein n=1 Tax=Litomosoides sigmodontis TaxID=42156 RepID=A0A3P6UP63_LITSI|nr:unnamed protein product [Litomosoides sigmodontis]